MSRPVSGAVRARIVAWPRPSRCAALLRIFALNRIAAIDLFSIAFQAQPRHLLNAVGHGAH
eukprot:2201565-Lingulodinium_polyedra.AAC.1